MGDPIRRSVVLSRCVCSVWYNDIQLPAARHGLHIRKLRPAIYPDASTASSGVQQSSNGENETAGSVSEVVEIHWSLYLKER